MSRPRPGGGECSAGCGATHSSNWFKKAPNKICRACYGRATQRVGTHQPADGGPRRSSPTSVTAEMAGSRSGCQDGSQNPRLQVRVPSNKVAPRSRATPSNKCVQEVLTNPTALPSQGLRSLKGGAEVSLPRGRGSEAEARTMRESAMRYIFPEECMRTDACMHMTR